MIPYSRQSIAPEDIQAVVEALQSPHLTQGPRVESFERALATYTGAKYLLVFNSATSALYAAYASVGIGEGDEVITTPLSFIATANMILALGAKPVFCDIKPNGNIDERLIPALLTPRTKAIVSVDFAGNPVEFEAISAIAKAHNLAFISDSSHAIGAEYQGCKVATQADATIFSFHAIKPLTTGEGGAIATNDEALYERAKLWRSHGIVKKQLWNSDASSFGFNFRLSDFAAALGESQLKKLDEFIAKRERIAHFYDEALRDFPYFSTLKRGEGNKSTHHLYPIFLHRSLWCPKEEIFSALLERGFGVQVHYKPIHTFSLYRELYPSLSLPVSEEFYLSEISIPCHQEMDLEQAREVVEALEAIGKRYANGYGCEA